MMRQHLLRQNLNPFLGIATIRSWDAGGDASQRATGYATCWQCWRCGRCWTSEACECRRNAGDQQTRSLRWPRSIFGWNAGVVTTSLGAHFGSQRSPFSVAHAPERSPDQMTTGYLIEPMKEMAGWVRTS